MAALTTHEQQDIARANDSGRQPILLVHGLWLLSGSWDNWRKFMEANGYTTIAPGWPDDPDTVAEGNEHPEVFAHKRLKQIADHYADAISQLKFRPAVVGHSFGGVIALMLAGRGASVATVSISPAPFRGVLPLPLSSLKSSSPVLSNPANLNRAVPLTFEQFQYAFANAVDDAEAKMLYETYAVPGSGAPLFQAASANLNPWTEDMVDTKNPARGPLLIVAGEKDHTVPPSVANAAYKQELKNPGMTEYREITNRGHSLTIDHGWQDVAQVALEFITRNATILQPMASAQPGATTNGGRATP